VPSSGVALSRKSRRRARCVRAVFAAYAGAQHRYIGAGVPARAIPARSPPEHFTLSIMFVPPGQGNAAHTHEVEEVFFISTAK